MIALTLAEIASAVGGALHLDGTDAAADTVVAGAVTTDSREIAAGDVFFAKRGEFDDGHRFAPAGRRAGCRPARRRARARARRAADRRRRHGRRARRARDRGRAPESGRSATCASSASPDRTARPRRRTCCAPCSSASARRSRRAPRSTTRSARPSRCSSSPTTREFLVAEMGASAVGEIARLVRDGHDPTSASC